MYTTRYNDWYGTDHMLGNDQYMPYLKDKFEIRLYPMNSQGTGDDFEAGLTVSTQSLGEFKQSYGVIEDFYGNDSVKFAGKPQLSSVSWVIKGYVGIDTQQQLVNWSRQVFNDRNEKVGRPSRYMRNAFVVRDSGDGDTSFSRVWEWRGVWPSELGFGDHDYTASDLVRFNVTLQVSRAVYLGSDA